MSELTQKELDRLPEWLARLGAFQGKRLVLDCKTDDGLDSPSFGVTTLLRYVLCLQNAGIEFYANQPAGSITTADVPERTDADMWRARYEAEVAVKDRLLDIVRNMSEVRR